MIRVGDNCALIDEEIGAPSNILELEDKALGSPPPPFLKPCRTFIGIFPRGSLIAKSKGYIHTRLNLSRSYLVPFWRFSRGRRGQLCSIPFAEAEPRSWKASVVAFPPTELT